MTAITSIETGGPASRLLERLGGRRGLIEGAIPPLVFAGTNAVGGVAGLGERALMTAIAAAVASAVVIIVVGVAQGVSLAGAVRGSALLVIAVGFVLWTGSARDFFLPGIYVDAVFALVIALSVLIGRPLIGYAYAFVVGDEGEWRNDRRLRRAFAFASVIWAAGYGARATAQIWLYLEDQPELLALVKVLLGWPLTVVTVVITVALVRRTRPAQS